MKYIKVSYAVSIVGEGYQELTDDKSEVIRHTDLDGNTILFDEDHPVEITITDKNPTPPEWGT